MNRPSTELLQLIMTQIRLAVFGTILLLGLGSTSDAAEQLNTDHPNIVINENYAIRRGPWNYIEGKPSPTLRKTPRRDELHP